MFFKDQNSGLHFLSDEDIANGGLQLLPVDCVEITDEEAEAIRAEQLATVTASVPQEVTRFQAIAAMHLAGLLVAVETMMTDAATDQLTVIAWQNAQVFKRHSPFVQAMAQRLGLAEPQLDDLFIAAAKIE